MTLTIDPAASLPDEIMLNIFSKLNEKDLATCCHVSPMWKRIASDNTLWNSFAQNKIVEFKPDPAINSREKLYDKYKNTYCVLETNQQLYQRIQTFVNRIKLGQNARFTCKIEKDPSYPQHSMIEIEFRSNKRDNFYHTTDEYVAVKEIAQGREHDWLINFDWHCLEGSFHESNKDEIDPHYHYVKLESNDIDLLQAIVKFPKDIHYSKGSTVFGLKWKIRCVVLKRLCELNEEAKQRSAFYKVNRAISRPIVHAMQKIEHTMRNFCGEVLYKRITMIFHIAICLFSTGLLVWSGVRLRYSRR